MLLGRSTPTLVAVVTINSSGQHFNGKRDFSTV
jgi:hypothetical protein